MSASVRIALVAALVAGLVLAGCSLGAGPDVRLLLPGGGQSGNVPVLLTDHSGSVVEILEAPGFEALIDEGVATIREDAHAIVAHWTGGGCDASVAITVHETSGSLDITVTTTRLPMVCDAIGIKRAVLISCRRQPT